MQNTFHFYLKITSNCRWRSGSTDSIWSMFSTDN